MCSSLFLVTFKLADNSLNANLVSCFSSLLTSLILVNVTAVSPSVTFFRTLSSASTTGKCSSVYCFYFLGFSDISNVSLLPLFPSLAKHSFAPLCLRILHPSATECEPFGLKSAWLRGALEPKWLKCMNHNSPTPLKERVLSDISAGP